MKPCTLPRGVASYFCRFCLASISSASQMARDLWARVHVLCRSRQILQDPVRCCDRTPLTRCTGWIDSLRRDLAWAVSPLLRFLVPLLRRCCGTCQRHLMLPLRLKRPLDRSLSTFAFRGSYDCCRDAIHTGIRRHFCDRCYRLSIGTRDRQLKPAFEFVYDENNPHWVQTGLPRHMYYFKDSHFITADSGFSQVGCSRGRLLRGYLHRNIRPELAIYQGAAVRPRGHGIR